MGERCLILIDEFKEAGLHAKHLLDTRHNSVDAIELVVEDIMNNKQYRLVD
ncbi:hypothetical protein D3C72_2479350 [compost metagenome]